ncbi:hypothetical protein FA95DRAFT_326167 [Auriscalpium vulgare]|uniref:Uncharacterized protein n=1 Tax=Auriscalpium vulgare TaxID=40419 RepID=A0ACB8RK44_9AGAM|nr:hypothetical protein FA95DRAFT_326167 [Auriscalpium vulgare]
MPRSRTHDKPPPRHDLIQRSCTRTNSHQPSRQYPGTLQSGRKAQPARTLSTSSQATLATWTFLSIEALHRHPPFLVDVAITLILEDLPRIVSGMPNSWWNVLKTARGIRRLVAPSRGKPVEMILQFLTTQDVCLQHGRRDTLLPALDKLALEYAQVGDIWESLPVELEDAFRVWLKDREEVGFA